MESLFPQFFFLSSITPFLFRIGAAVAFYLVAEHFYKHRAEIAAIRFPIIGVIGSGMVWVKMSALCVLAFALLLGVSTQGVAAIGLIASIKCWIFSKRYPSVLPHGRLAYFLLGVICLSLIITGAGLFAIDKPY